MEHWHDEMEPWVHYVPVAADLSDLLEHRSRLESDPGLYVAISANARRFAGENLKLGGESHIWQPITRIDKPSVL